MKLKKKYKKYIAPIVFVLVIPMVAYYVPSSPDISKPTYAQVSHVVDGDTLLLRIDLGFQCWKEQRVRLAEINTPEIKTKKGREAYEFMRDKMARLESVMIKVQKIDIYGRYVTHVFYSANPKDSRDEVFLEGRYLNQELLARGFATRA